MSSDGGRHEIEAAKQRLAAAKKLSALTKAAYDAAEKEVKDAQEMLDKIEKRWEVIDIDNEADISVQNEGNSKKRKVSLSPQSIGASSNRNDSITSAAASSSSQITNNDTISSATLTSNGISKMYHMSGSVDEPFFMPTLQVIHLQKVNNNVTKGVERYKLVLSDGQHFFTSLIDTQLNHMVNNDTITRYCILRISKFIINTMGSGNKICIILGAEHVRDGGSSRIGAPCDYIRTLTSTHNQNRSTASSAPTSSSNNNESSTSAGRAIGTAANTNEAPQQITVTGCGISQANGVYKLNMAIMGRSRYAKVGRWKGSKKTFTIRKNIFSDSWSLYAHDDCLYDVSSTDTLLPPKRLWEVFLANGVSPAPTVTY